MRSLSVELGDRGYPIHIGSGLLTRSDLLKPHLGGSEVLVVTNETLAPLYLDQLVQTLNGLRVEVHVLPDGERFKTLEVLATIFDRLLALGFSRRCTLLALGGGVVGDMTGFAAACYQRGVDFIQIPTTLLAQVDSSVGGKTGVNHPGGKNMIGAFHQPRAVLVDTDTLTTLPDRELRAGLAEVIKYGLIRDIGFLAWIETHLESLLGRDTGALTEAIARSCQVKADVVAEDEREGGVRAILNLGHTFGHAIETATGYTQWLHGEAVAAGMVMAADLSRRLGWISDADLQRVQTLIERAGLPSRRPKDVSVARLRELMQVDKKVMDGELRLVLLKALGMAVVEPVVDESTLAATLAAA